MIKKLIYILIIFGLIGYYPTTINAIQPETLLVKLYSIELKLLEIDEMELNQQEKNLLADAIQKCEIAILKLQKADLLWETIDEYEEIEIHQTLGILLTIKGLLELRR